VTRIGKLGTTQAATSNRHAVKGYLLYLSPYSHDLVQADITFPKLKTAMKGMTC
jgi:transposase